MLNHIGFLFLIGKRLAPSRGQLPFNKANARLIS